MGAAGDPVPTEVVSWEGRRRALIAAACALSLCAFRARAQTSAGKRRLAYLSYASPDTFSAGRALPIGVAESVVGCRQQHLVVDYRSGCRARLLRATRVIE